MAPNVRKEKNLQNENSNKSFYTNQRKHTTIEVYTPPVSLAKQGLTYVKSLKVSSVWFKSTRRSVGVRLMGTRVNILSKFSALRGLVWDGERRKPA